MSAKGRQFIYYYRDSPNPDEENDALEKIKIPKKGTLIKRRGRMWRVQQVHSLVGKAVPVYIVYLADPT